MSNWLEGFARWNTYEDVGKACGLTPDEVREVVLREIEDVSRQIEMHREELAMWVDYIPNSDFFIKRVPEVVGYNGGKIFALKEEFEEICLLRHKFEVNAG